MASYIRTYCSVVALAVATQTLSGCINEGACGICDEDNLVLEAFAGPNYTGTRVRIVSPACEGDDCPAPFETATWFTETIGLCEETDEAEDASRPDDYCKVTPLLVDSGLDFVFNNNLEATSIELVRSRPDNTNIFEVYDWKTRIINIEGPITRYNGDYRVGVSDGRDSVTRSVNLTCIENLRARGVDYASALEEAQASPGYDAVRDHPCYAEAGLLMQDGEMKSYRGSWDSRAVGQADSFDCDDPESGADTCCNQCDFSLSVNVAKYGVSSPTRTRDVDALLTPSDGAHTCSPDGDKYVECKSFIPWVNRADEESRYSYVWDDGIESFALPYYDKLRETHPDDRPPGLERKVAKCTSTAQCLDPNFHDLPGTECVGTSGGAACSMDAGDASCQQGRCIAQWFVQCAVDPERTGAQAYCVDSRFSDEGAAACFRTGSDEGSQRVSECDIDGDGRLEADEDETCCEVSDDAESVACDPIHGQNSVLSNAVSRYDRSPNLPVVSRECTCDDRDSDACNALDNDETFDIDVLCASRDDQFAVQFVSRLGGVILDPAIKGVNWLPADLGGQPRAVVEACAEERNLIAARNKEDGWRARDSLGIEVENFENYDRGLCSGEQYTVVFATAQDPANPEYIIDQANNTLLGKARYTFSTPQFHVVPGSGYPSDALRIGACEELSLRFTNKYDLSPANLRKIMIAAELPGSYNNGCAQGRPWVTDDGLTCMEVIAGGTSCAETAQEAQDTGAPPCLTMDVSDQPTGQLRFFVDPADFRPVLEEGQTYHVLVPGMGEPEVQIDRVDAFWDVCGKPLELGGYVDGEPDYNYSFTVDAVQCVEDDDRDGVQLSCDNAPDVYNPGQVDTDQDGVGDAADLCPTVNAEGGNEGDADGDGVGNDCDSCRRTVRQYNELAAQALVPAYLQVRNNPSQVDSDQDGIGDVCDNCVATANCANYGPSNPYVVGSPLADDDETICQRDSNADMIGDVCLAQQAQDAAGPVGFGDDDDFDQDGIVNLDDACPRQPVPETIECASDEDCGNARRCEKRSSSDETGICNHEDSDGDGVGNICDTCPRNANPLQIVEGAMQEDDPDGDFVGSVCETTPACESTSDPRPLGFFEVAVDGLCCTTLLRETSQGLVVSTAVGGAKTGDLLLDPDGLPVLLDCADGNCRQLPDAVLAQPGVVNLPAGCDAALAEAGYADVSEHVPLTLDDVDGELSGLWDSVCLLPQIDQDYDGIGDVCDLCPYAFDPDNQPFEDENGRVFASDGKFCTGVYSAQSRCQDEGAPADDGEGGSDGTESSD